MHQHIAKANHLDIHRRVFLGKESLLLQRADTFTGVLVCDDLQARANVIGNIHQCLNRRLQTIFGRVYGVLIIQKSFRGAPARGVELA